MGQELLLGLDEVGRRLGLSRRTVQGLIHDGGLSSVKIGRCRRIAVADLEAFVERLREQSTDGAIRLEVMGSRR